MNFFSFKEKLIPLDEWVQDLVDWLVYNHRDIFQAIKAPIELCLNGFEWVFTSLPPLVIILFFIAVAWRYAGKGVAAFTLITLLLVGYLGLWEDTMVTLAMVVSSVFFCALAGIPLGIMAGRSDRFEIFLRPALDAMQTIPPFVYLVPVVMLFSIGTVSGILATIVFALPPIVRLTSLGIRQVHPELIEAALSFGATDWQVLRKVQFPLALPSIMAGLNQTLMMALSMVVIAALIGAGGLGNPVVQGLNTLEIGLATIGGLAIVMLAMMLDRITQSFGQK
ncbi:glycine betaine/proline transport system permease protein [Malonomonas rubra DSM 5091]|uniref:Glycine betaine/proline transport system permease protein n=1 Tax=Malonomonas rubra DSM 5091 TaxID=1122189 RepID=A0A1M6ITK1_MALRU|nr:proline/glycine betaine ABC transporter permease [Malonomonas rubra]SHJ37793.1 glycine betaine/proline transport system permease protein [Malonomonas rubra DSM 5091]